MIIEILQLFDLIKNNEIHLLIFFFVFFTFLPVLLIKIQSKKYQRDENNFENENNLKTENKMGNFKNGNNVENVTVIVPVYHEDYDIFEKCISSISAQRPDQLILSIDSDDNRLIDIATKYGAEILRHGIRVGKRKALAEGWLKANNNIIVHVDSDIILENNCLKKIIKCFEDEKVGGVSTEHLVLENNSNSNNSNNLNNLGSYSSYILSYSIELSRSITEKALNGHLIVADGKCNAWRKEFLLDIREKFINEYWMDIRCEIGDDRYLSREAIKHRFKTIHSDAKIHVSAPDSFKKFVKQQIRWRRSGAKFWIKDIIEGVRPSKLYTYKCFTYYLSPFVLPIAIFLDMIFFKSLTLEILSRWDMSIITIIVGTTLVTIIRQLTNFGRILFPRYIILQSLLGLFVMLPISIYGMATIKRQDLWMTRKYS